MASANISIIPEFVEKIELLNAASLFDVKADSITNTQTKSDIIFKGIKTSQGNQTANLKSIQGVNCWVLDEAEELVDEGIFDKIDDSIRVKDVQNLVILVLNPVTSEHWIYKRFFEGKVSQQEYNGVIDDVTYIHTTYEDNVLNLSDSFLKKVEIAKQENYKKYLHSYRGHWLTKAEGAIFNFSVDKFSEYIKPVFGLDFGFNPDPDALVKVAIDKKRKQIYVKECIYQTNNTQNKLISQISQHCTQEDLIIADSAEPRLINDIRNEGFNIRGFRKYKGSVESGIRLIQDYELIIDNDSHNLIKELNNYVWSDKKAGVPIDNFNHLLDAMRYIIDYQLKSGGNWLKF